MAASSIQLIDARVSDSARTWLEDAYVRYIEELIPYGAAYVVEDGRPNPDHLPYWLTHDFCRPLVGYINGTPAAFALIGLGLFPYMDAGSAACIAELYVAPSFRRAGVGRSMFQAILPLLAGRVELSVLEKNVRAHEFWRANLAASGILHQELTENDETTFFFNAERQVVRY